MAGGVWGTAAPPNLRLSKNCRKFFFLSENFSLKMQNVGLKISILGKVCGIEMLH